VLHTEKTIVPHSEQPTSNYSASRRILVVSAEAVIRDLLERFLEIDGHQISAAADRSDALAMAKSLSVDLVVLDSDLPQSSQVRSQLLADEATAHLPVLWIGTRHSKDNFGTACPASMDGVLPMPFTFRQIKDAVSLLLGPA
jgi:DNA-binding response OmpR family regulator